MQLLVGMAYSDVIIHGVLKQLIAERGQDAVITQTMIAEASGVPLTTCQYALRRLMSAEKIKGTFTAGSGYKYKVIDGTTEPAG